MRRLALLLALLCAAPLSARGLRIDSPANGTTLRGGSFATLAWSAESLPRGSEEWEAFLSVDGGDYYAFRITPHLELDVRSFAFLVPNVDARDARILIRTGDEHRETVFELPASFRIEADRATPLVIPTAATRGHAEPARPGDRDVVAWADGDRAGEDVTTQSAVPGGAHIDAATRHADDETFAEAHPARAARASLQLAYLRAKATRDARVALAQAPPPDLLLVCRRRNI